MLATELSHGGAVQAVAYKDEGRIIIWIANLTGEPQEILMEGFAGAEGRPIGEVAILDLDHFIAATGNADDLETAMMTLDRFNLGAYAVMRVRLEDERN